MAIWRVRYKLTKSGAWVETSVAESNSMSAWRAYQIIHETSDYAAEAFDESA